MKHAPPARHIGQPTSAGQYADPHGPTWMISVADAERFAARLIDPNNPELTGINYGGPVARGWQGSVDKNPDSHQESMGDRLEDRAAIIGAEGSNTPISLWSRFTPLDGTPSNLVNIAQFKADYEGEELDARAFFKKYWPTQSYDSFQAVVQSWKDRGGDTTGANQ